jgi:hypothetical protein
VLLPTLSTARSVPDLRSGMTAVRLSRMCYDEK